MGVKVNCFTSRTDPRPWSRPYLRGGGVQGVQTSPEIFRFFLKSEGKEIERKEKKGCWGGGGGVTS